MDTTSAPQIIEHQSISLDFTPYDTKWIPGTAKFVLGGQTTKATGIMKIYKYSSSPPHFHVGEDWATKSWKTRVNGDNGLVPQEGRRTDACW